LIRREPYSKLSGQTKRSRKHPFSISSLLGVSGATSRPAPVIPDLSPGESGEFSPASRDPPRLMISEPP